MQNKEGCWISLILRVAVASLLLAATIPKWMGGVEGTVSHFQALFKESWLPLPLVTLQARLVPFVELLLPIWLLVGFRLRLAWIVTCFFLVTLGFGMVVAGQYETAAHNYFYVLLSCAGLYFSRYDAFGVGGQKSLVSPPSTTAGGQR